MSPDPTHDWWRELQALGVDKFEWSDREWRAWLFDGTVVGGALPLPPKPADALLALRDAIADRRDPGPVIDGAVVGFRAWALNAGGDLTGIGYFLPWADSGPTRAECGRHSNPMGRVMGPGTPHPAPTRDCSCGLYGLYERAPGPLPLGPLHIYGAFLAWGEQFYLHPTGFRAEYGRVVLLAIPDGTPKAVRLAIEATAERYGADTCSLDILDAAAREHGDPVPRELRPAPEVADVAADTYPLPRAFLTGSYVEPAS